MRGNRLRRVQSPPTWETYWGWMVVFSRFIALFMLLGTYKSFGVLLNYYIEDLNASAAVIGWAASFFFTIVYFMAPIFGVLCDLLGPNGARILIMAGGVIASIGLCLIAFATTWVHLFLFLSLAGIGYGMVQVPTVAPLLMYFTDNFGLANGISAAGGAVGMLVLPVVTEFLIQKYTWRGASIILGVASLHTAVAGALMRPTTTALRRNSYSQLLDTPNPDYETLSPFLRRVKQAVYQIKEQLSIKIFFTQPSFVLYLFVFLLAGVQFAGWHLFLVPNALSRGVKAYKAVALASIGGISNIFGRAGTGPLLDYHIFSDTILFGIIHLCCSTALLCDPLATAYITMAVLAFVAGATIGASYAVTIVIGKNLAGESSVMAAVGWTHFAMGFGAVAGGPLVGGVYDMTGKYSNGFMIMGGIEMLITIVTFVETLHRRCTQTTQ